MVTRSESQQRFTESQNLRLTKRQKAEVRGVSDDLGITQEAATRMLVAAGLAVYRSGSAADLLRSVAEGTRENDET